MKVILIIYGIFSSLKWLANYLAKVALIKHIETLGFDIPNEVEVDFYVREEVRRIFKRDQN